MLNTLRFPLLAALLAATIAGCSREDSAQQAPAAAPPAAQVQPAVPTAPSAPAHGAEGREGIGSAAGLTWTIPGTWTTEAQRPMRMATYATPTAEGDTERGEVAVFHFGPSEGGTVEANVERWFRQFDQEDGRPTREVAERESIEIGGMPVTIVRARGAYNAAAGPMAPRADIRPGYALIGAIAEGPEGAVFFKFTGPEQTVATESTAFGAMIDSLRPQ